MAAAYGIYHGPEGLRKIAQRVHLCARTFAAGVQKLGLAVPNHDFFDTVHVRAAGRAAAVAEECERRGMNIRVLGADDLTVSFDETTLETHITELLGAFADAVAFHGPKLDAATVAAALPDAQRKVPAALARSSKFMQQAVFNSYHSETEMMRFLDRMASRDLSLTHAMIPLGSCTMKLNAASEMIPVTWPTVNGIHPFAPKSQTKGYRQMIRQMSNDLAEITGFAAVSLMPNSGAQGEYTGLLVIDAYQRAQAKRLGQSEHRNICLIPVSAHGTNPASAVMAGMRVVPVQCDAQGNVDVADLKAKAAEYASR
jgi:glycine dehydrogenase